MITFAFHLVLTLIFTFAFDFSSNLRLRIETNEILPVPPRQCYAQLRGPHRRSKGSKGNKGSTNPKQGNPTLIQDLPFALAYSKAREPRVANVLKIKTNATFSCCPHRIWCLGLWCILCILNWTFAFTNAKVKFRTNWKANVGYSQPREARSAAHLFPPPEVKSKGSEGWSSKAREVKIKKK